MGILKWEGNTPVLRDKFIIFVIGTISVKEKNLAEM